MNVSFRLQLSMAHGIPKLPIKAFSEHFITSRHEEASRNTLNLHSQSTISLLYLLRVQLNVLHWLGIKEKHHLLNDVHLVVHINGFVKSPIIWGGGGGRRM